MATLLSSVRSAAPTHRSARRRLSAAVDRVLGALGVCGTPLASV